MVLDSYFQVDDCSRTSVDPDTGHIVVDPCSGYILDLEGIHPDLDPQVHSYLAHHIDLGWGNCHLLGHHCMVADLEKNFKKCALCHTYDTHIVITHFSLNKTLLREVFLVGFGFMSHQDNKGYMVTLQLYWCRKTSSTTPCIIFQAQVGTGVEPHKSCKEKGFKQVPSLTLFFELSHTTILSHT